jgi:hypothetical protein
MRGRQGEVAGVVIKVGVPEEGAGGVLARAAWDITGMSLRSGLLWSMLLGLLRGCWCRESVPHLLSDKVPICRRSPL